MTEIVNMIEIVYMTEIVYKTLLDWFSLVPQKIAAMYSVI